MTNLPSTDTSDRSLTRDILYAVRYYLGGRRTLFVLAAALIVGGIALNWGWLVAAGFAPILIAFLPCAVMCAVGLCMHKTAGGDNPGSRSVAGSAHPLTAGTVNSRDGAADTAELFDPAVNECCRPRRRSQACTGAAFITSRIAPTATRSKPSRRSISPDRIRLSASRPARQANPANIRIKATGAADPYNLTLVVQVCISTPKHTFQP